MRGNYDIIDQLWYYWPAVSCFYIIIPQCGLSLKTMTVDQVIDKLSVYSQYTEELLFRNRKQQVTNIIIIPHRVNDYLFLNYFIFFSPWLGTITIYEAILRSKSLTGRVVIATSPVTGHIQHFRRKLIRRNTLSNQNNRKRE